MTKLTEYLEDKSFLEEQKPGQPISLRMGILIDADALIALVRSDDSNHQKAAKISKKLQKVGADYYLSPFTIPEVATVLSYKVSHQAAKDFLTEARRFEKELDNLSIIESPKSVERLTSLADKWFLKQKKKGVSYPDCYNMALMERYKTDISGIFSFDSIYKRNGFKTVEDLKL